MSEASGSWTLRSLVLLLAALATWGPSSAAQEAKTAKADDDAIASLETQAKEKPADAAAATRLGSTLLEQARRARDFRLYARAEAALKDALARDAKHVPAMVLLASCHLDQHRFREAIEVAGQALAAEPDSRDALAVRGDAYLQLGELERAREDYEKLLAAKPDLLAHARMAGLLYAEGDAQAALDSWAAAVRASEQDRAPASLRAWSLVRQGELHFRTGNWDEAGECYKRAAAIEPDDPDVLDHLAELHAARGEFDEAIAFCDKAIARAPRPEFYRARGDILLATGDAEAAYESHQKALEAFREAAAAGYAPAYRQLAAIYCDVESLRHPEEALRWARRDLQIRRTVATFCAMGWGLYHAGKHAEAAAQMDKALRVRTIDPDVLYRAGLIYSAAGDPNKSRLYLRQAAAANPKFQEFHFDR